MRVGHDGAGVICPVGGDEIAPEHLAPTFGGRLHDRRLVKRRGHGLAGQDVVEEVPLAGVEAHVDVAQVGVVVDLDTGCGLRLGHRAGAALTQRGVPCDVAVDQGVGGRGGVGDDLGDGLVEMGPAKVVVGVGDVIDLRARDPLVELVGSAGHGRVQRDGIGPLLGRVDLSVDAGRRHERQQVVGQEGSKDILEGELDGIGVDLRHVVELAPVEGGIGVEVRIVLHVDGHHDVIRRDRRAIAPLRVLAELDRPDLLVRRDRRHPIRQVRDDVQVLVGLIQVGEEEPVGSDGRHVAGDEGVQALGISVQRPDKRAPVRNRLARGRAPPTGG